MSTNPKHTPTPWELHASIPGLINGPNHTAIVETHDINEEANAARIVQCVNACEGIEDPAAFVAAIRECALFWAHGTPVHAGAEAAEQLLAVFRPLFNADDLRALGGGQTAS
jgi:hypothetical protein